MNSFVESPAGLETKYIALDHKFASGAEINGHASLFGAPDQNGDIVEAGAFAESLRRLERQGRSVKFLWQHDPSAPIGVWDAVFEDRFGLAVQGRLLTDLRLGAEAAVLLNAGAVDGLSIGYRTIRAERAGKGRRLLEIDLWEVSLVTFPMLPTARASAKTPTPEADIAEELAQVIRDAREALA